MSYKFLRVTSLYNVYLEDYYLRNPDVKNYNYSYQLKHLVGDGFSWGDYLEKHLQKFGVDCYILISNAHQLQRAWCNENNVLQKEFDIVTEQIKKVRPDVLFIQDSFSYNGDWIENIKKVVPSIKKIIGYCCSVVNEHRIKSFAPFDFMITCTPGFVSLFKKHGLKAYLMYHAFESSILELIDKDNKHEESDVIFVGSLGGNVGFHRNRIELIEQLLDEDFVLSLYCNLDQDRFRCFLKKILYLINKGVVKIGVGHLVDSIPYLSRASSWESIPRLANYSRRLAGLTKKPIHGIEMFKALKKGKIGLNVHAEVAGEYAGNIRMFEVTGVGTCLLTEDKVNIKELFEPDFEIVTYKTIDEAKEKISWLLDNPNKRKHIASAGQKKTLSNHNYFNRAAFLNDLIRNELVHNS